MRRWQVVSGLLVLVAAGCAGSRGRSSAADERKLSANPSGPVRTSDDKTDDGATTTKGELTRKDAEKYILELINRDRTNAGLTPVAWDAVAAQAGQRHARDMAEGGFTAHWGRDGSVPEQRYSESGGMDFVQENAGCFGDGKTRELEPNPRFSAAEIARVHAAFFDEKPPHDGHRRNILTAWHTHVGVGFAKAKGVPLVCMAQEFVDHYGVYDPLQKPVGSKLRVSGEVTAPAAFVGVGVARLAPPQPKTVAQLRATGSYAIPAPTTNYFPKGFKTPIAVSVVGNKFFIDVPTTSERGILEISVWGRVPGTKDNVMLSLRTLQIP